MIRTSRFGLVLIGSALLVGCAGPARTSGTPKFEEGAVIHQVAQSDIDATHSREPLSGTSAVLWVNGLGCPQCATNMDMQMKRSKSVTSVRTDLGHGKVYLTLSGKNNPSPHWLSERTLDAGFTLVKIEQ